MWECHRRETMVFIIGDTDHCGHGLLDFIVLLVEECDNTKVNGYGVKQSNFKTDLMIVFQTPGIPIKSLSAGTIRGSRKTTENPSHAVNKPVNCIKSVFCGI